MKNAASPIAALVAALLAAPAAAECVDLSVAPPQRVVFADGTEAEILSRDGGVLRYRIAEPGRGPTETEAHLGTVPITARAGESGSRFAWDTPLPAAAEFAPGARIELAGRVIPSGGGAPGPAHLGIEVGDWTEVEIDGCRLRVLRMTLRFGPPEAPLTRSERLWDPVTLLSYETEVTIFGRDGTPVQTRRHSVLRLH